jgi:TruD family tRNA pseudouridine synthase
MNYTLNPNTFFVKEVFNPKLTNKGTYNYYLITKKDLSHKQLTRLLPTGYFCGMKDKNATTTQWFCSYDKVSEIENKNVIVEFKGMSNERIHIGKHKGNLFKIKVDLEEDEFKLLNSINFNKKKICNYFGDQRFDSRVRKFSELIDMNNWEEALKFFLTSESKFDSEKSTEIKKVVKENWGDWKAILQSEVLPDSKKELFGFLDLDGDYKKAFDFVEKKSLKQMLRAIQSQRFNLMLHNQALDKHPNGVKGMINGEELLLGASKAFKRHIFVQPTEFEKSFNENGMSRKTFFQPKNFRMKNPTGASPKASMGSSATKLATANNGANDPFCSMKKQDGYWIEFELAKGTYATVLLEFLKNYD